MSYVKNVLDKYLIPSNSSQSIQDVFRSQSFQNQSMIVYDQQKLLRLINYHLNYVHEAVEKLQSLFPEKS